MKITILYDDEAYAPDLMTDHGFSCLIEKGNHRILFDTGGIGRILLRNMNVLGIKPRFDKIVISHNHMDHIGGLPDILRVCSEAELFTIGMPTWHDKIKEITGISEIADGVHTTGPLGTFIKEQSLVVENGGNSIVITGCAHPGLARILRIASRFGSIYGVVGGLEGFNEYELLREWDLKLICPCHCTVHKREIKKLFPKSCVTCGVGRTIELEHVELEHD